MTKPLRCQADGCRQTRGYRIVFASGETMEVCGNHVKNPDTMGKTAVVTTFLHRIRGQTRAIPGSKRRKR